MILQKLHKIAIFMDDYYDTGLEPAYYIRKNKVYQLEEARYHLSWDWLMECIDKIEKLGFQVSLAGDSCQIYQKWKDFPDNFIIDADFKETRLENAFDAVVAFIEWFETNGESTPAQERYCEITKEFTQLVNDALEPVRFREDNIIEQVTHSGRIRKLYQVYPKDSKYRESLILRFQDLFFRAVKNKKAAK